MRVFYIFNIKPEFKYLYKDSPSSLFNILKQLYYLKDDDIKYGKSLFNQLVNSIDKYDVDNYIFIKFHQKMDYSKKNNIHYLNNLYKNEISRLIVKRAYIKLEIENGDSYFFDILSEINSNLFACNFEYLDFFWIDGIKSLV